jgi:hypothetical protein
LPNEGNSKKETILAGLEFMGFGKEFSNQPDFSALSRNFLLDFFQIGLGRVMLKIGYSIPREGFIWV